ncbi:hypothetical protein [Nostoc sp.]|uniref:hypothetical protein n=1 Tax=Nostoc sp. TaxID=1180 RepID=UPI002FFC1925
MPDTSLREAAPTATLLRLTSAPPFDAGSIERSRDAQAKLGTSRSVQVRTSSVQVPNAPI